MNRSTVGDVSGMQWASSAATVEATFLRRPGGSSVEVNTVNALMFKRLKLPTPAAQSHPAPTSPDPAPTSRT